MKIAGIVFKRTDANLWVGHTDDGRPIELHLMLHIDGKYPWRVVVDGRPWKSKWSTPYAAMMRVKNG